MTVIPSYFTLLRTGSELVNSDTLQVIVVAIGPGTEGFLQVFYSEYPLLWQQEPTLKKKKKTACILSLNRIAKHYI